MDGLIATVSRGNREPLNLFVQIQVVKETELIPKVTAQLITLEALLRAFEVKKFHGKDTKQS